MDPLTTLQVAIKNNVDVFYFSCSIPYNVLFAEDGQMGKAHLDTHSTEKYLKKHSLVAFFWMFTGH